MPINRLLVIGFVLVLIGAVLPFLIVIRLVESTFLLNGIAMVASTVGIFLGVIGTAMYVGNKKKREDDWHNH
jgi:hypothetical protein